MPAELGARSARRRQSQRRRLLVAGVAALALVVAVVVIVLVTRSDEPSTRQTARHGSGTTTSSTGASTTTTSTVGASTTVVPRSTNPVVALAQQYDGYYTGTFTNETFHTSGAATLEVRIDPAAGTLESKAHFDGDLFGGGAKQVRDIESTVKITDPNAVITVDSPAFGVVTAHIDSTLALVIEAKDVPDPKVATFSLTGRLNAAHDGFDATYTVGFENGKTAQGTVSVACAPTNQRTNEVNTLCHA